MAEPLFPDFETNPEKSDVWLRATIAYATLSAGE
jgi:hypothetical protein